MSSAVPILPADILARIRKGERVELPELGAAVVSLEDLRAYEALEDRIDNEAADAAVAEWDGKTVIPWEQIKAEWDAKR